MTYDIISDALVAQDHDLNDLTFPLRSGIFFSVKEGFPEKRP